MHLNKHSENLNLYNRNKNTACKYRSTVVQPQPIFIRLIFYLELYTTCSRETKEVKEMVWSSEGGRQGSIQEITASVGYRVSGAKALRG